MLGAKVLDIFSMAGRYNKPEQYRRESAHKSRAEEGNARHARRATSPSGRSRRPSAGPERSQQLQILPSLTVRRFSAPAPTFC